MVFTQSAVWEEVVAADSSLSEETNRTHSLECIRISPESVVTNVDGLGKSDGSNATLYWLLNKSMSDGDTSYPAIKAGDRIVTDMHTWTVVSISEYSFLYGGKHHLEIGLR